MSLKIEDLEDPTHHGLIGNPATETSSLRMG